MVDLLNQIAGLNSAAPAVRRPTLEVSFGGGGDSGIGGAAAALGSALGIGGGSADKWKQAVVSVSVECGLAPSVDGMEVTFTAGEQAPSVAVGDTGSVKMGYEDSSTDAVFTGEVESVRYSVQGLTCLKATNGGAALSRLRVNQSYEQQKAGDVVSDLASRAEVETDTIENGLDFPYYVIDDRLNAYQHIATLARKSGYMAFFTTEGKLSFVTLATGQAVQTFTYGLDILSLQLTQATALCGEVTVFGEGAAGSQGQDAWSWLVKDPSSVKGSAGEGKPVREAQDATLRSGSAAQSAAEGIVNATGHIKLTGKLLVPGSPAVAVGSTIEVVEAPDGALNGSYLVRGLRHHFSKLQGFTTLIFFSKSGDNSGGGLGLPGGLL